LILRLGLFVTKTDFFAEKTGRFDVYAGYFNNDAGGTRQGAREKEKNLSETLA